MRRRKRATALLIDFDGVLRQYDPAVSEAVEAKYGLGAGSLLATGLEWHRLLPAVTGHRTRRQWLESIAEAAGAPMDVLLEWDEYRGYVDRVALALVRRARTAGLPVALVTNATDDLRDDLAELKLDGEFDAVISSTELGVHKPSREFFAAACESVATKPELCLLVDDADRNIRGARVCGLAAMRWTGPDDVPYIEAALGLTSA